MTSKPRRPAEDRSLRNLLKRVDQEAAVLDAALQESISRTPTLKPPPLKQPALASLQRNTTNRPLKDLRAVPSLPAPDEPPPIEKSKKGGLSWKAFAAGTAIGLPILGFAAFSSVPPKASLPGSEVREDDNATKAPSQPATTRFNMAQAVGTTSPDVTIEPPTPSAKKKPVVAPAPQPVRRAGATDQDTVEPSITNTDAAAIPFEPPPANAPPMMPPTPTVKLSTLRVVKVRGGDRLALPLKLIPPDGAPTGATIIIKGLSPGFSLSAASPGPDNTWVLVPDALGLSRLIIPAGANGEFNTEIVLLDPEGQLISRERMQIIATPKYVVRQMDEKKMDELVTRANALMRGGAVAEARLLYERAAEAGSSKAAFALGESFDPVMLERRGVLGLKGDETKALLWYERAHQQGVEQAAARLRRLLAAPKR